MSKELARYTTDIARNTEPLSDEERFLIELEVSDATKLSYKKKIRSYVQWVYDNHIVEPTVKDVKAYKRHLEARGLSASSINQYLAAIRSFYRWAESEGIAEDVARSVKNIKVTPERAKDDLSDKQVKRVLNACEDEREYALLSLLFATGLRTIEIARATVGSMRTRGGLTVLYVRGKGRTDAKEYVKLTAPVEEALSRYFATRPGLNDESPLFASVSRRNFGGGLTTTSIQRIVVDVFVRAGVRPPAKTVQDGKKTRTVRVKNRVTPHSTRHTTVTLMLKAGVDPRHVQAVARHRSFATTQIYAHDINRLDSPAEATLSHVIFDEGEARS